MDAILCRKTGKRLAAKEGGGLCVCPAECLEERKETPSAPRNRVCVFQDWLFNLTMQQQSVLILACRGPDGVGKFHPTKQIVARYRATVLKAAYLGRAMRVDEGDATTFMSLIFFGSNDHWDVLVKDFFDNVDELQHHYYMHLLHGAQIAGYKHPLALMRERWYGFYLRGCSDLHLYPETEEQMDARLSDWDQKHWGE